MKFLKKVAIAFIIILALLSASFFVYVSNYYHADKIVVNSILQNDNVITKDNHIVLQADKQSDVGLIFYPGGKVEYEAYLSLLNKLQKKGITCIIVKMPFNLAVFNVNVADEIYKEYPEIKKWYIAGHSLGGAMASDYTSRNNNKVNGLILLGSYIYGDVPIDQTITIYGTEDNILDKSKITYTKNINVIEGGNHSQFGNYGVQNGDGKATISADMQQNITADKIVEFIRARENIIK